MVAPPSASARLSVVMITRNEEQAVARVIGEIRAAAPEAEILLVDSSQDGTAEKARELGARVIRQFPPQGYGPAMDLALRSAAREVIVTLDCDGSYPAEMIPILARYIMDEDYDLVDGARLKGKPAAMPWGNYLANLGFALAASLLFLRWLPDLHSGMRAYRRGLIQELRYDPRGAALPVELLTRPIKNGKKVKIVHIDYRERVGSSTLRPLQSAWWTLRRLVAVRFS